MKKASDALWQLLLGILDKGTLTLGDNRRVDLSQTMIFMTSNLGGHEISEMMTRGMGFIQPSEMPAANVDTKIDRTATEAAKRKFSPEFMNRIDKLVVFHPLRTEQLQKILDIELAMVQKRVLDTAPEPFIFRCTADARTQLLQEGTDRKYGARHLKRAIERHVVYPLANLLATDQVNFGDVLCIDYDASAETWSFAREGEGAILPVVAQAPQAAAAASASGGRAGEAVAAACGGRHHPNDATGMTLPPAPATGRRREPRGEK